jgi:hypothetical protein
MRHALGLDGQTQAPRLEEQPPQSGPGQDRLSLHRPPRRFVKDGEVPVTVVRRTHLPDAAASIVQPAANQLEAARQTIRSQAAATERAERALNEAHVTIRDLRTKLAHERLAKDEAYQLVRRLEGERDAALSSIQDMRVDLATERVGREKLEQELRRVRESRQAAEDRHLLPKRPRGRPRKYPLPSPLGAGTIAAGAIAAEAVVGGVGADGVRLDGTGLVGNVAVGAVMDDVVPIALPKKRGRPRKIVVENAAPIAAPKKRGRPRKVPVEPVQPPRPRGRPRKIVASEQTELGLAAEQAPRRLGRPPKVREPKPVKWWTKGWKSKAG